jgi:uncharacterized protein YacL
MSWSVVARIALVAVVAYCAHAVRPFGSAALPNVAFGAAIAGLIILLEDRLRQTSLSNIIGALAGGTIGLLLARLIGDAHFWANDENLGVIFLHTLILLALPYIGLTLGAMSGEWLAPERLAGLFGARSKPQRHYRILDTSVIIDGRIADICETGFVDGTLVVPQFVLKELQQVADSADSLPQPRPPGPRHPAAHPEDGGARRHHFGH